jgi:hypothetical protein
MFRELITHNHPALLLERVFEDFTNLHMPQARRSESAGCWIYFAEEKVIASVTFLSSVYYLISYYLQTQ